MPEPETVLVNLTVPRWRGLRRDREPSGGFCVAYDETTKAALGRTSPPIVLAEPLPEPEAVPEPGHVTLNVQPLRTLPGEALGAFGELADEWFPPTCPVPDVSVVIRFWNGRLDWLQEAIDSALAQEGVTVEVIIVDDGSDVPVALPQAPRIGLLRFPYNRGIGTGSTRSVALCRGTYIRLLDHDDRLPEGALLFQSSYLRDRRAKLVHGQLINMTYPDEPWKQAVELARVWDGKPDTLRTTLLNARESLLPGPAGMWKRSWKRPMPPPDFVTAEDQAMYRPGLDVLKDSEFGHPPDPVLIYRPASETSNVNGPGMPGGKHRGPITNECVDHSRELVDYYRAVKAFGEPLRVAFVEPALDIGGAQWFSAMLAVELYRLGHQPRFFCANERPLAQWVRERGVPVESGAFSTFGPWLSDRFEEWQPHVIDNVWRVSEGPTQFAYDALHVAHAQGERSQAWTGEQQNRDGLDLLICVADAVRDIAPEYDDRAIVIRNSIDVELYRNAEKIRPAVRAMLGIAPDELVVTFCGRLSASEKQVRVLYDVIAELEPAGVTFVIGGFFSDWAGDRTDEKNAYRAATEGRRVLTVDQYMPWDAAAFHSVGDVYLSTSNSEGLSLALLEAMACCVPTVTTAAGGQAEAVIEGATGFVVPVGDVAAISDAVRHVLNMSPEQRRDIGRFGRHVCAARYHSAYNARTHVLRYLEAINAR